MAAATLEPITESWAGVTLYTAQLISPRSVADAVWDDATAEAIGERVLEIWRLKGLDPVTPLVVTATNRTASGIVQRITQVGQVVTVRRQ